MLKTEGVLTFFTKWWLLQEEEKKTCYVIFLSITLYRIKNELLVGVRWNRKTSSLQFFPACVMSKVKHYNQIWEKKLLGLGWNDHAEMSLDWKTINYPAEEPQIFIVAERGELKGKMCHLIDYISNSTIHYLILNSDILYTKFHVGLCYSK